MIDRGVVPRMEAMAGTTMDTTVLTILGAAFGVMLTPSPLNTGSRTHPGSKSCMKAQTRC